jgi:hypothetical protein
MMISPVKIPYAWLFEEFNSNNELVNSFISPFKPSEVSFKNELKTKLHNITLTPLYRGDDKAEKFTAVKKYNSKLLVEANPGL